MDSWTQSAVTCAEKDGRKEGILRKGLPVLITSGITFQRRTEKCIILICVKNVMTE